MNAHAEITSKFFPELERHFVSFFCKKSHIFRCQIFFSGEMSKSMARRIQFPTTSTPTMTRRTIGLNHHMSHLAGKTTISTKKFPLKHQTATDARPKSKHNKIAACSTCTKALLSQSKHIGIVIKSYGTLNFL